MPHGLRPSRLARSAQDFGEAFRHVGPYLIRPAFVSPTEPPRPSSVDFTGGCSRTRTCDPLIKSQCLRAPRRYARLPANTLSDWKLEDLSTWPSRQAKLMFAHFRLPVLTRAYPTLTRKFPGVEG